MGKQSGLVFNTLCATLILKEPFTHRSLAGTILVCAGALLIATFGAMKEPAHSLDQLLELLAEPAFLIWMGGQGIVVLGILGCIKISKALWPEYENRPIGRLGRGVAYGCVRSVLVARTHSFPSAGFTSEEAES